MPELDTTVLVVDDELSDLERLHRILSSRGYKVISASDGEHALRKHARFSGKIDLLVTDVAMSPMTGCELARQLTTIQKDLKVLFVSGHVGEGVLRHEPVVLPDSLFLRKPFTVGELLEKVGEAVANKGVPNRFAAGLMRPHTID